MRGTNITKYNGYVPAQRTNITPQRFGSATRPEIKVFSNGRISTPQQVSVKTVEQANGTNIYDILNNSTITANSMVALTGNIKSLAQSQSTNAGTKANINKTSQEVLDSVTGANKYTELSAAKIELQAGKDKLCTDYNESSSSYIKANTQEVLKELGISVPDLGKISGKYEDYALDVDTLNEGQNSCQELQDTANEKLPEISTKKCTAQSKVDVQKANVANLKTAISAAKANNQDTSALEAQLNEAKQKLKEAEKELEKYKKQEQGLKDCITQAEKKKTDIDKDKEDLKNYHIAEGQVKDKTYDIAQSDDKELEKSIQKLKKQQKKIKKATQDLNKNQTNASDESRNRKLENLQQEYQKLAKEAGNIYADIDLLISENNNSTKVENSEGRIYSIKNYDEAKKILVDGEID